MPEDSQLVIPQSFIDLFIPAGRLKPTAPRDEIAARYELCEDLATALTEHASTVQWQHGATQPDVLERVLAGLRQSDSGVDAAEAQWIVRRLAELLGWSWQAA